MGILKVSGSKSSVSERLHLSALKREGFHTRVCNYVEIVGRAKGKERKSRSLSANLRVVRHVFQSGGNALFNIMYVRISARIAPNSKEQIEIYHTTRS